MDIPATRFQVVRIIYGAKLGRLLQSYLIYASSSIVGSLQQRRRKGVRNMNQVILGVGIIILVILFIVMLSGIRLSRTTGLA